jgi:hypothetical protein
MRPHSPGFSAGAPGDVRILLDLIHGLLMAVAGNVVVLSSIKIKTGALTLREKKARRPRSYQRNAQAVE